ncbi:hypothetical protein DPMN_087868 [Dreissena polymorpha]|uniref:Uncharacterized protein n=1 Tax=Dreissena polymorpha TaxID=45954 RepID=A0A9D4KT36_DREPO|nr:hypothetical protein DPMN_087868 [Dreissena polymorpha]
MYEIAPEGTCTLMEEEAERSTRTEIVVDRYFENSIKARERENRGTGKRRKVS